MGRDTEGAENLWLYMLGALFGAMPFIGFWPAAILGTAFLVTGPAIIRGAQPKRRRRR